MPRVKIDISDLLKRLAEIGNSCEKAITEINKILQEAARGLPGEEKASVQPEDSGQES